MRLIIGGTQGDIFETPYKHVVFGVNTEGINDSGFAGAVSGRFWSELANCGHQSLGTVLEKRVGDKTFYAIVCHSLETGWEEAPQAIKEALDKIDTRETIASVAIGEGLVGKLSGANPDKIQKAMQESSKEVVIYRF